MIVEVKGIEYRKINPPKQIRWLIKNIELSYVHGHSEPGIELTENQMMALKESAYFCGLTYDRVCLIIGRGIRAFSNWVNGYKKIPITDFFKLCDALYIAPSFRGLIKMPIVENAPKELNDLLERTYLSCYALGAEKDICSKTAWENAKKQGWVKEPGGWVKRPKS